jgi:hypothetical protein
MSSTIFASKKRKRNVAKKDDDSEVEDDFADESDANKDGEESDNGEPEDEDGSGTVDDFQGKEFDISRTVDLESGDLADVLSEKDSPVPRKAVAKKTPTPAAAPKVLSEEDWEM